MGYPAEKQLTFALHGHILTNINVWTPDSQWIVYDVRPDSAIFCGQTIERVNVQDGKVEAVYHATQDAFVGVATVSPQLPIRYAFIHGPENPDANWQYDFHHRRGVIVLDSERKRAETLDALDITPPYTVGALRGGSHVHVFSPDGTRLSFTYNDHVMHQKGAQYDLRNVGIALPLQAVRVNKQHPREYDGSHFCVLISQTTPFPQPGSDDINRAYEESWIGEQGYLRQDGKRQRWALAFIGDTVALDGSKVAEVFVVDLPEHNEAYRQAGDLPLEGTDEYLPAPPAGVKQRRLTFTAKRKYPGIVTHPRHWLRSSPDGSYIAFLMRDDNGVVQLYLISPNGGEMRQITDSVYDVQSAFSWHPDGRSLFMVMDNSVVRCDIASGALDRVTLRSSEPPCADAVVVSPDGKHVVYMRKVAGWTQIFSAKL